jgi:hypothetical protein
MGKSHTAPITQKWLELDLLSSDPLPTVLVLQISFARPRLTSYYKTRLKKPQGYLSPFLKRVFWSLGCGWWLG